MILMYVSLNDSELAKEISTKILERRLANHVNIVPKNTSYQWIDNQIVISEEVVLLIKTKALLYADIERLINHEYAELDPKMFSVPVTQIDFRYYDFLKEGTMKV